MGFSIVTATAMIGLSMLIVLESLFGVLVPVMTDIRDSNQEMQNRAIEQFQTNINITNVAITPNGSNFDINFTLENLGKFSLETDYFNVLIDGENQLFKTLMGIEDNYNLVPRFLARSFVSISKPKD